MNTRGRGVQGDPRRPMSFRTPRPSVLADEDGASLAHAVWPLPWRWPLVLATAMVSATVLLLEVTLTRIFSLYLSYHYVFVVLASLFWQGCWGYGLTLLVVTGVLTHTALASVLPVAAGLAMLPFVVAGFW